MKSYESRFLIKSWLIRKLYWKDFKKNGKMRDLKCQTWVIIVDFFFKNFTCLIYPQSSNYKSIRNRLVEINDNPANLNNCI